MWEHWRKSGFFFCHSTEYFPFTPCPSLPPCLIANSRRFSLMVVFFMVIASVPFDLCGFFCYTRFLLPSPFLRQERCSCYLSETFLLFPTAISCPLLPSTGAVWVPAYLFFLASLSRSCVISSSTQRHQLRYSPAPSELFA